MKRTERFADLAAVRAEKQRLAAVRDAHGARLQAHYAILKRKEFRAAVAKETLGGLLRHAVPQSLEALWSRRGLTSGLQMALGGKGGWAKRAGLFAVGLAAPALLKRMQQIPLDDITRELMVSLGRLREYVKNRRADRPEKPVEDRS